MNREKTESALLPVVEKKKEAAGCIHSLFSLKYPVGVGVSDKLHLFKEQSGAYRYSSTITLPMKVPPGTKAAFNIGDTDECCCVITPNCFEENDSFVTILHEFVHCYQSMTCEGKLKSDLGIYRHAMARQDHMWEINHPFPYESPEFTALVQNILEFSYAEIMKSLSALTAELDPFDSEFLIWQIWKEGFARYLENRIRRLNGLEENNNGSSRPGRASLYFIGDIFWTQLALQNENLTYDIEKAFGVLKKNMIPCDTNTETGHSVTSSNSSGGM